MPTSAELKPLHLEHVARLEQEYARVIVAAGWDGVVLHSGTPKIRSIFDDQYWPVRVTPHFQHWLPLADADCALLVMPGKRPVLYRNVAKNYWERTPPADDFYWPSFDVVEVADPETIKDLLPKGQRLAFIGEDLPRAVRWGFPSEAQTPTDLTRRLDALRVTKSRYEEVCLAHANRIAAIGHDAVFDAFQAGDHSELELHLLFLRVTRQDDPETPYKNIVAFGTHAATLHHIHYGRVAPHGAESLLVDAGATFQGYASDVTRTRAKGAGAGVDAFRQLIARMEELQQEMVRRIALHAPYESLHDQSHQLLAPVLRDCGLVRASDDELVGEGVTRLFLPHGLGHALGLQTHDVGCAPMKPKAENPWLRNTSKVEPGQVFTIEPGCYFIPELLAELRASKLADRVDWKQVDLLARFGGVRIEDDVAVHDGAVRNLTREVLPQ